MGMVYEERSLILLLKVVAVPKASPSGIPKPARTAASKCGALGSGAAAAAGAAAVAGAPDASVAAAPAAAPAAPAATAATGATSGFAPGPRVTSTGGSAAPPFTDQSASRPSASLVGAPGCTFTRASLTSCPWALAEVTTTKLSSPVDSGCTPMMRVPRLSLPARESAATGSLASTQGPPSGYTAPSTAALSSTGVDGTVTVRTAPRCPQSASTRYSPGGTRTLTGPTPTFRPPT